MSYGDPPGSMIVGDVFAVCPYWPTCGCSLGCKYPAPSLTVTPPRNITPMQPLISVSEPASEIAQLMERIDMLVLLATDLKDRIEASDKKMDAVWNGQNLVQQGIRELAAAMRTVGLTGYSKRKGDVFAIKGAGPSDQDDLG